MHGVSGAMDQKEAQWIALQESLARQLQLPQTECAPVRDPSDALDTQAVHSLLPVDTAAFVHKDFRLPWSHLESMLSSSQLITNETRTCTDSSVTPITTTTTTAGSIPDVSVGDWRVASNLSVDLQCWTTQLLLDVAAQQQMLATQPPSHKTTPPPPPPPLEYIGGIDISFVPNTNVGVACLAVLRYPSLELCHRYMHHCVLTEPYVSGFLAFREVEPVMALFGNVREALVREGHMPQLLFVDGCGVHHPRRCGLASHLGALLGIPTIGCAKKMLIVGHLTREFVETHVAAASAVHTPAAASMTAEKRAKHATASASANTVVAVPPLMALITETPPFLRPSSPPLSLYGYALQTSPSVRKCIFVSPGTRVGYAMAAALVLLVSRHRVPEPIRAADLGSREYIRETFAT